MKKKKITYGVSGMMEYQAVIKVGKKNVSILFSDGSVSAMGTNPATYTTDNLIIQHAIEDSADYRRGRIKTVSTIELDEELRIERPEPAIAVTEQESNPAPTEEAEATESNAEEGATPEGQPEEAEPTALTTQVEFSCNDDAKDYLEQNFGYVRSKLRNREDIVNAGKAHGVEITFV